MAGPRELFVGKRDPERTEAAALTSPSGALFFLSLIVQRSSSKQWRGGLDGGNGDRLTLTVSTVTARYRAGPPRDRDFSKGWGPVFHDGAWLLDGLSAYPIKIDGPTNRKVQTRLLRGCVRH
ncbi:hypothetical protein CRG98_034730 [Punica granatum]|uniref:Uncharacterized protein n=1 Tax=Punica granatum TaxID=22663 RepID=A0A2I0ILA7_PUNGR|nr:hypothetical protein CRG98_034730 [Punica granatum]